MSHLIEKNQQFPDEMNKETDRLVEPILKYNYFLSKVETVVSISCDLDSFVKDSKILIENNYILKWVQPIDQFLYSPHLEIVGFFQLNEISEC